MDPRRPAAVWPPPSPSDPNLEATEIENTMRFQSHGGTLSHPPCEKPRMCRMSGRKIRKSTFSLLECALLDEDWMHLFDSAHLLTTTTRSRRPHRVLSSSPNPPGPGGSLTQLWLDQNSIGDAGARRGVADVVLEQKSSARRGQSSCTDVLLAKVPQSADVHQTAIALERQLRGLCQI